MTRSVAKATVIGGAGFIGRHLVRRLRSAGWDCEVPSRQKPSLSKDFGHIFYCAGMTGDYRVRPFDTVESHVNLLSHVLQESEFSSLVYLSSTRLYDSSGVVEADETTPLVLDPQEPRHIYDLSKALGESLCHRTGDGRARVARLSNVYNHRPDDGGGFLAEIISLGSQPAGTNTVLLEAAEGSGRDYVLLDDVLDALIDIAVAGTQPTYNVASGTTVTNTELFDVVRQSTGVSLRGSQTPISVGPRIAIDRMVDEFGWQPVQLLDRLPELLTSEPTG